MKSLYFITFCFAALVEVTKSSSSLVTVTCKGKSIRETFESCLANISSCFGTNCTIKFDNEVYRVPKGFALIENKTRLSLEGTNESVINCSGQASFGFINVAILSVTNVKFLNCGANITNTILQRINKTITFPLELQPSLKIGIFLLDITDLCLNGVKVDKSLGYGIVGLNLLGNSIIINSMFIESNVHALEQFLNKKLNCSTNYAECSGGNALFIYTDFVYQTEEMQASLSISNTDISRGANFINGQPQSHTYNPASSRNLVSGGGISLVLLQKQYKVNFEYKNSFCFFNYGFTGANVYINVFRDVANSSVLIEKVMIAEGNSRTSSLPYRYRKNYPQRDSGSGGGVYYEYGTHLIGDDPDHGRDSTPNIGYNISFNNIQFLENTALNGGGMFIRLHLSPTNWYHLQHLLTISDCSFTKNHAFYGAALYINELQYKQVLAHKRQDDIFLCNIMGTSFMQHSIPSHSLQQRINTGISSTIFLNGIHRHFKLQNVSVVNSMGCTGMLLINSAVICDGITIENNTNIANGGGVILTGQSYFILFPNSVLRIANNTANHGGGIYIPTLSIYNYQPLCFFQVFSKSEVSSDISDIRQYNASIVLMNNTAEIGYDIYGGDLEDCYLMFWDVETKAAYNLFIVTDESDKPSKVTSYAETICFCVNQMYNCDLLQHNINAYPGQIFLVSVVPVGQFNAATATERITINYPFAGKGNFEVKASKGIKNLGKTCNNLSYTIQTKFDPQLYNDNLLFYLLVEGTLEEYYWKSIIVNVTPCPPFFYYNNDSQICECMDLIHNIGITCSTNEASIHRPYTSYLYIGYHSNCTYAYSYCPIDRCGIEAMNITAEEQDKQCVNNREGILCGKCKPGYSRVIGSNKCKKCSNVYLLLIFLFAVLGILLVWLLSFFNLTVSTGMINGIIFYANIVKVNRDIFYPVFSDKNVLSLFVAWINLDFGFEVCLFDGMTEFHKTLLQLAFPVYLWILSLAAIYLTRHHRFMGKIFGKHSTPALATVLLLSFTKLLNIVSRIFSPIRIKRQCEFENTEVHSILAWWSDADIAFNDTYHIVLMVVAIIFIVFGILPYTLLLVTSPFLHRFNQYKMLRWVARLKPFLDAYEGPYNESSQYWTGLLLLVRIGLMIAFATNIYGYTELQLFIIAIASIFIMILTIQGKGIYRSKILNYVEVISIINLAIYSIVVQYLITLQKKGSPGLQADVYVSSISLLILVVQVALVVLFQVAVTILTTCGIVEENNVKAWILNLIRLKTLNRHTQFVPFSRQHKGSKCMMGYNTLGDNTNSLLKDSGGDSSTDEDLWNKSVDDFREPLLEHLTK